jgi:hypothetical protein
VTGGGVEVNTLEREVARRQAVPGNLQPRALAGASTRPAQPLLGFPCYLYFKRQSLLLS